MKTTLKMAIILVVAGLAAGAVVLKKGKNPVPPASTPSTPVAAAQPPAVSTTPQKLPKLVDLGAGKCIPCKKMAPILEELKKEYAGKMEVEFVDVWQNPDAGNKYGIRLIPTQIFYDSAGKELFRHEGFFGKEDILGKWKALGVDL
jgi:thioredoxin 1